MIFAVLRHNHPPRYFPFRLLFPTIATPYHTMAPRADNKRQTRRKPAVTPTRVQPIRLGEASGQAALRPPPELTASVSGPSDPLGAKDFDVKQTQSTLQRSVERSLSTTTGAERGSRNHPSPKAIEPTVHTPQITVNMQAAGVAVENHTAGSSSKWAARSPPVELPAKRGRDISSLNPASTFGDPIKRNRNVPSKILSIQNLYWNPNNQTNRTCAVLDSRRSVHNLHQQLTRNKLLILYLLRTKPGTRCRAPTPIKPRLNRTQVRILRESSQHLQQKVLFQIPSTIRRLLFLKDTNSSTSYVIAEHGISNNSLGENTADELAFSLEGTSLCTKFTIPASHQVATALPDCSSKITPICETLELSSPPTYDALYRWR